MKPERLLKMIPLMFAGFAAAVFLICGAVLEECREHAPAQSQDRNISMNADTMRGFPDFSIDMSY